MPDSFIAAVNNWGLRSKRNRSAPKLEFLNRRKEKFDWDNDEMEDDAMVEDEVIYPEIPAEFPGLLFDRGMSDDVVEVKPELSNAQLALAAAVNADIVEINTTGVPSLIDEVIIDDDDDDDEHYPLLLDSARFTGVSPTEVASIAMGVEPEAVTVEEGADGDEDDDKSVDEL